MGEEGNSISNNIESHADSVNSVLEENNSNVQVKELEKPHTSNAIQKVEDPAAGNKDKGETVDRDAELARIVSEKRLALIKAWEESEKTKAENRAYKKCSAVGSWESTKEASIKAQLKIIEEKLERKKAEYVEKMKNKIADIHRSAEEMRAMVEANRREEYLEVEETAAKFRSRGTTPRMFFSCFSG